MQWGFGHTAGVLLIATLLLLLKEQLPLDAISAYSERIVGMSLIVVGAWGVWKASRAVITPHSHTGASFAMGAIHGLAGSSHLFGVLPALAFSVVSDSILYLAGFGLGAIAGMTAFAAGVGLVPVMLARSDSAYFAESALCLIGGRSRSRRRLARRTMTEPGSRTGNRTVSARLSGVKPFPALRRSSSCSRASGSPR